MWPSGTRGNSINASDKQVTGVPLLPTPSPWATTAAKKKTTTAHTFQEKGLNKSSGRYRGHCGIWKPGNMIPHLWYRSGGGSWGYGRNSSHTTLFPSAPVNEPTSFCACTLSWAATVKLLPFQCNFFLFFQENTLKLFYSDAPEMFRLWNFTRQLDGDDWIFIFFFFFGGGGLFL